MTMIMSALQQVFGNILEEELGRVGMLVTGRGEEGSRGERKVIRIIFEKPKVFSTPDMNKPGILKSCVDNFQH